MNDKKQIKELADAIYINCPACLLTEEAEMIAMFVVEEQGYRKQEWISVDERLPEESGVYVACTDNGNPMTLDYSAKHKLFNSFDSYPRDVAEGFAIPVTHWMPLPEAPKMKGGKE